MSWGALIALLVEHKCKHTNNIKHVYVWVIITMQDIKRVLRERSKRKHQDMFWGSSHHSTSPSSHRKISTIHYKILHKGTSAEELQLTKQEVTTSTLTPLHKRKAQPSTKQSKITAWSSLRSQIRTWWSNDHKQNLSQYNDPRKYICKEYLK